MTDLPGLRVHVNEGRVTGPVDFLSDDMSEVIYGGRVMLVLVADVGPVKVADSRDGTTKATWTLKVVDAAVVHENAMKTQLSDALLLTMQDQLPGLEEAFRNYKPVGPGPKPSPPLSEESQEFLGAESLAEAVDQISETHRHAPPAPVEHVSHAPSDKVVVSAPPERKDPALSRFLEDAEERRERQVKDRVPARNDNHLQDFLSDV